MGIRKALNRFIKYEDGLEREKELREGFP